VINTLRNCGMYLDEASLGVVVKRRESTGFSPHIFFDDKDIHLEAAANLLTSGKVPSLM